LPANSPLLVPRAIERSATRSPSATRSSTAVLRSGNAVRKAVTPSRIPSGPRVSFGSSGVLDDARAEQLLGQLEVAGREERL
jgi:hypothetical protein